MKLVDVVVVDDDGGGDDDDDVVAVAVVIDVEATGFDSFSITFPFCSLVW